MIYRMVIIRGVRPYWDEQYEEYIPGFILDTEELENINDSQWLDYSGITTTSN